jgi:hypothetical protein
VLYRYLNGLVLSSWIDKVGVATVGDMCGSIRLGLRR